MTVQNKFEVLVDVEEVDHQWAKFKTAVREAAVEQIARAERVVDYFVQGCCCFS